MPNAYSGQRFIPASHVGQYQTMGGGQGGGLGTSWGGAPPYGGGPGGGMGPGGGQMPQLGGGGMPGGGGPNWFPGSLGYDQTTGQPWGTMKSIGLNLGNFMQDQKPGWGMTQGGIDPTSGQPWGTLKSLGMNLGQQQGGGPGQMPQGWNVPKDYFGQNEAGGMGGPGGMLQQPSYNPPPGYFNPSQTALQQGNYTQPNFTMAGQGGPGFPQLGGGMAPFNQPKPYQQQAAPNPPMAYGGGMAGGGTMTQSDWPSGYGITQGSPLWDAYQQNIQGGQNQQRAALFADPTYGQLAQGVQNKAMDPQAAVQKALAMGATPQQIQQWANLLGMGNGGYGMALGIPGALQLPSWDPMKPFGGTGYGG